MVSARRIAVIPARGGSKRIAKKNIVQFHGKPMIAWTIEAALSSNCFARVVVSTDDEEISDIARRCGASVPFMRERYADDLAPVSLATLDTLQRLQNEMSEAYDTVVQLMANCPLRGGGHIAAALHSFDQGGVDAQISCFKFGWMNPWWAATLAQDGTPTPLFPEAYVSGSQHLPPLYCPTGAVWIAKTACLLEHQTFHAPGRRYWPMPWQAAIDIDDHDDLRMAEVLFQLHGTSA